MPLVLDATVGGANSNSYLTVADAQAYFDSRAAGAISDGWDNAAPSQEALLVMATRVLNAAMMGGKTIIYPKSDGTPYYLVKRVWNGSPATTTQRLAWPRSGLTNMNGVAISSSVIPQELKDATAELAGSLSASDTTLDSDASVQGLQSVRAGSVALTFKNYIEKYTIPNSVWALIPPNWYTDEYMIPVIQAQFDVIA